MTEWGIDTLFNPGKRHMDEEKRRLQSTREEVGDSSGGRRIDLESGTVVISRKKPANPTPADPEAASEREAEAASEAMTDDGAADDDDATEAQAEAGADDRPAAKRS
ncbi:MAG: hypothetical protein JWN95_3729 [Frankiales bacterium]|nr:hypothetical protein [Frankiales bacterium]